MMTQDLIWLNLALMKEVKKFLNKKQKLAPTQLKLYLDMLLKV